MASDKEIQSVWEKGKPISGKDPKFYRKDLHGNTIYRPSYGKNTDMGWEIDHHVPKAKGGKDTLDNKKPLQTTDNRQKSDKMPANRIPPGRNGK